MAEPNDRSEMRDLWADYNARQHFEHSLLDRKTTWLLASQALLFAAYGVSYMGTGDPVGTFRTVVACTGFATAGLMGSGSGL